jgi:hypothetical protein
MSSIGKLHGCEPLGALKRPTGWTEGQIAGCGPDTAKAVDIVESDPTPRVIDIDRAPANTPVCVLRYSWANVGRVIVRIG